MSGLTRSSFLHTRRVPAGTLSALILCLTFAGGPEIPTAAAYDDPFATQVRPTEPLTPEEERLALQVPPGFRVQLFAAEPDIQKPMNMAFDSRGRIWVTCSSDYPYADLERGGDSIRILEDTTGDGRADKVTLFADGITIPIGLYPFRDGVIAFSIPNIWFFRDTTGDGRCDTREMLYGPFDFSRDTHGLNNAFRRGYDGWIYACHGFNNHSRVAGRDGHAVDMQSGNTYRFRPDGSRIEQFTWGQVNPFGMTFDKYGDLYSSDCHTLPITLLLREGRYPSFGKPHDGLGFVPPVMKHSHGSTAIAGVGQYTGDRFPEEYRESLFVGNVMTSRVHRDIIEYDGSSPRVVEQPDFILSRDPWFRPVDIQSGPDGSLYVADFYNRIIGHYEVPLDHPGRDRHRGRIWRIVYDGPAPTQRAQRGDLSTASAEELIAAFDHPNLGWRIRALDELTDRIGPAAVPLLRRSLSTPSTPLTIVHLLWGLHRLGNLKDEELLAAAGSEQMLVRLHAQRILAERETGNDALRQSSLDGLEDTAPLVQRAAAEALARQPSPRNVDPLLARLLTVSAEDVQLRHSVRIALRSQLRVPENFQILERPPRSAVELREGAEICLGLNSPQSAHFLIHAIPRIKTSTALLMEMIRVASRSVPAEDADVLAGIVRDRFADEVDAQVSMLNSLHQGLRERGDAPSPAIIGWAEELAGRLLDTQDGRSDWTHLPHPDSPANSWGLEPRNSADGRRGDLFLSSLPGGEQARGTLRSRTFLIPDRLEFFLCGHLGFPNQPAIEENYVRLCLAEGDQEITRNLAPRNDLAQRVTWELGEQAGREGYLEIVDGLALRAYAWIAISRIEPAVARIPEVSPSTIAARLRAAAELAGSFQLVRLRGRFTRLALDEQADLSVRQSAAVFVSGLSADVRVAALAGLIGDPTLDEARRQAIGRLLIAPETESIDDEFLKVLKTLAGRQQLDVARQLAASRAGGDLLLTLAETGILSPRVFQSAAIRQTLLASGSGHLKERVDDLLARLPAVDDDRQARIAALRGRFATASTSAEQGRGVFEKRCAVCHQIGGQGKVIGPQLDGIGNRGLERLLEDILDPNRNVDVAFRSRTYALTDGRILTGVFRRREGELTVIADNKGEELSFPTTAIEAERVSPISIMPDNWSDLLPEQELLDLLAWLLTRR